MSFMLRDRSIVLSSCQNPTVETIAPTQVPPFSITDQLGNIVNGTVAYVERKVTSVPPVSFAQPVLNDALGYVGNFVAKNVVRDTILAPVQPIVDQYFCRTIKEAASSITGLLFVDHPSVLLSGANSISFSYAADIAVEMGIGRAFIQPWYIKPTEIKIQGTSYLGAFPFIQKRDDDVATVYAMYLKSLNEFSHRTMPGDKTLFRLQVANNPMNTDIFYGYIRKFDFKETQDKPYVLEYDIEFVGKPRLQKVSENSSMQATKDKNLITQITGPSLKLAGWAGKQAVGLYNWSGASKVVDPATKYALDFLK